MFIYIFGYGPGTRTCFALVRALSIVLLSGTPLLFLTYPIVL